MRMFSPRRPDAYVLALVLLAAPLPAQHEGHAMPAMQVSDVAAPGAHIMAQAIPLLTRADPTAGGTAHTQLVLTQVLAMARIGFWKGRSELNAAFNGEGITMADGELNTGANGEGFVDRRHPHAFVHEVMLTGRGAVGPLAYSASAGRGFAPFGTDDPMRVGHLGVALRLEQSDRPEEDRLQDPYRTPRPATDLSINGITQWRAATLQLDPPAVTSRALSGFPFLEVARLSAAPRDARSLFTPDRLYGTARFWMLTAGVRLRAGATHARMGRYGVAASAGPSIGTLAGGASPPHSH